MDVMKLYERWLELDDADIKAELVSVSGQKEEIRDRFYRELEFGTGGLRGVIGAGTNRINIYTIRKTTQGLANYLKGKFKSASVAISFDSRIKSDLFAKEAAGTLAANGIKAYIYRELMPTPALSFAVRDLNCQAGIMITASHNPAKYNGYKVYGPDGCQMTTETSDALLEIINNLDIFSDVNTADFDKSVESGLIEYIGKDTRDRYLSNVKAQLIHPEILNTPKLEGSDLKVVYTPLHGAGNRPVRETLRDVGIYELITVKRQQTPDGNFPTCPFPNPEYREALALGLETCEAVKPDLLLATDPDCDRVGIAVRNSKGEYILFTGNEVGALLLEYICRERTATGTMPENPVAVKTIVSTGLAQRIAEDYGVELINVLTGFKFIGEQILLLEQQEAEERFIFGFEESYGYLAGTYVRDKDAVVACMLICEMAAFYKKQGKNLCDALQDLYDKYGIFVHGVGNFVCEGESGMQRMAEIMKDLRDNTPESIGGKLVLSVSDYMASVRYDFETKKTNKIELPKADVIEFGLEDGATVIIRPSGTEPKIKAYYTAVSDTKGGADKIIEELSRSFEKILGF